jgi:hypothetical protein
LCFGKRYIQFKLIAAGAVVCAGAETRAAPITTTFGLLEGQFVVREVAAKRAMLDDVRDARRLIGGDIAAMAAPASDRYDRINFLDPQNGGEGHFAGGVPFPGDSPGDDQSFAVRVRGWVEIPEAGVYTIGVNSDDGFRLRVGPLFLRHHAPRSTADSFGTATFKRAGRDQVKLTYFEGGNDAELELYAARGANPSFPAPPGTNPTDSGPPRLGPGLDVDTPTTDPAGPTVPEPAAGLLTLGAFCAGSLLTRGRRRRPVRRG